MTPQQSPHSSTLTRAQPKSNTLSLAQPTSVQNSSTKTGSHYDNDPFANMHAWVDYQEKIQLLKTTITPMKRTTAPKAAATKREQLRRSTGAGAAATSEMRYLGSMSSNISVNSFGSSNSSSTSGSDGCITPPRSLSPMTLLYEETKPQDGIVPLEEKVRFLSFLRQRTGWHAKDGSLSDLNFLETGGSLFWNGYSPSSRAVGGALSSIL
jgi:hypothetical protein